MSAATQELEKVLKVSQVARHLNCQDDTVYHLIRKGALRSLRVGRLIRIPESSLREFIEGGGSRG